MSLKLKFRIIELFGSQANFAQNIGVQESLVSRVVKGRRVLPKDEQRRWAKTLHVDVEYLFGRSEPLMKS